MEIKKFLGIRNTASPERFKVGELEVAADVDTDSTGKLLTRKGTTIVNSTPSHSLYSNHIISLLAQGSNLYVIESNLSLTLLKALTSSATISYETVQDTVYYSNGIDKGRIVGRKALEWGVVPPVSQPVAVPTYPYGNLPPGKYLYALTFLREDGHESGTGLSGQVDLPSGGGISFSDIEVSTNPEISGKIVYISGSNGEVLYRAVTMPNSQTLAIYSGTGSDLTVPLITQFASPPPAGNTVREYNGVMYVVAGDVAYHSDPYALELFRLDTGFLQFPARVAMFEAVNGGLYVATVDAPAEDQESSAGTWYLPGPGPGAFGSIKLFDYGAIYGSAVRTDASYFESPWQSESEGAQARLAVVWSSRHGVCLGRDGGSAQNLTESVYSLPSADKAAGMIRQHRGYVNYVVSLQGVGTANNQYVGG